MNIQIIEEGGPVPCELCGCMGNHECGHESPTGDCTLNAQMFCPCCMTDMKLSTGNWMRDE